ncbi:peptidase M15 [Flavobacterium sp. Sd200]|uniref:M15 family metallopeptidase n=1 Tax=Flavobacterium sp. Sd200 TaxID=2692211 RepID=UPI00136A324F|nr:M15 family metallopeptidase [Flavobacterium sp. Sd200]MXN91807.1 peptidase M15 [Flavobacterium sp. Sd200]
MKLLHYIFYISLIVLLSSAIGADSSNVFSVSKSYDNPKDSVWSEINFDSLSIINKMAYADTANFMHQKVYPCARCFLRPEVAQALEEANEIFKDKGYKIVIYDCYRPISIQHKMFRIVNNPEYVARPTKGSNHNRGAAVDLSLADENGNLLDMGGVFDDFSEISHYNAQGLSKEAKRNRKLLRTVMIRVGFSPYESEWWHFDYKQKRYPASGVVWECN